MDQVIGFKCLICGNKYLTNQVSYVCPDHGNEGILDVEYDYERIARQLDPEKLSRSHDYSIWRYKPLLPMHPDSKVPPLSVGWTPLFRAPRLGRDLGLNSLWIKDDGRQPTGSLKDRASALAIVKAQEVAAPVITTASTGNAAAALSGLCASIQQPNVIFVPTSAPPAKIAQLLVFGSRVLLVDGSYDDAFELCLKAAQKYGWYNRNTGYNPYMSEGKKTAAYEICEQLGWQAPDRIFVSVGDGCIIGGLNKGLKDLKALGWIDKMPKLMGVQAAGSSFLFDAWQNRETVLTKPPISANTVADSISAGLPRDRVKAMAAVEESQGAFVKVSDAQILSAIPTLARGSGVFAEPAGAAAYAGVVQALASKTIAPEETIVILNTGNGLKDVAGAMQAVEQAQTPSYPTAPDMDAVESIVADWKTSQ